jgi:citrate synthase
MVDAEQAARRLGVRTATLYAYVSRGRLTSHRAPDGRRSLFDLAEVEGLARRSRAGRRVESRLATVTTSVTHLTDHGPVYRGTAAVDLAGTSGFEDVAEHLWGGGPGGPWEPAVLPGPFVPPGLTTPDALRWAVLAAGATDPMRSDLRPLSVVRAARRLIATMVDKVPPPGVPPPGVPPPGVPPPGVPPPGASVAARLASRLASPDRSHGSLVESVNAALVMLADHELATSTVAVRVAASTRADLYDAVTAGLATLAGPLHGGASREVHTLLVAVEREGLEAAVDRTLRTRGRLPGFGHSVYRTGDPRVPPLLDRVTAMASPGRRETIDRLLSLAVEHAVPAPNVDFALGALAWSQGLPDDAGRTLFSVARVAGWTAHYLEEIDERPVRFRARAVYAAAPAPDG